MRAADLRAAGQIPAGTATKSGVAGKRDVQHFAVNSVTVKNSTFSTHARAGNGDGFVIAESATTNIQSGVIGDRDGGDRIEGVSADINGAALDGDRPGEIARADDGQCAGTLLDQTARPTDVT